MSAESENEVTLQLQELLSTHHSFIGLEADGELRGARKNDQYIYDYIPKEGAKQDETLRLIFEGKIDMSADNGKSIEEKFVNAANIHLPWTSAFSGPLPTGWTFHIKTSDNSSEDAMIEVQQDDNPDLLKLLVTVREVDIVGYRSDKKAVPIELDDPPAAAISLLVVVKNLD